jgi:DNA (cytosine-5)-methyltransferase 1
MRVLDLFSGIGGFSLGLERAGMRTVAFCETDPYCRAVLRKHWPAVPCFEDVRDLHAYDVWPVDLICGGFPCQDISTAGKGAGLRGERSGLWSEYRRLIEECRPAWVVIENVSALRSRGLDTVLGELAALGYDAEWHCIPASAVGAPHRRDRIWIVAYPCGLVSGRVLGELAGQARAGEGEGQERKRLRRAARHGCADVADADDQGESDVSVDEKPRHSMQEHERCGYQAWSVEPDVGRMADGVPSRVDRLSALGNAVVPQIPEIIGRAIMSLTQNGEPVMPICPATNEECSEACDGRPPYCKKAAPSPFDIPIRNKQ